MGFCLKRAAALLAAVAFVLPAGEAFANPITLTQAKALAGGITPGDPPGFPIILSQSGSYIFETNIFPTAGANGIEVTAPYVTIDLNGFLLHGGGTAQFGITTSGDGLTVKNGTVAHFTSDGIAATSFTSYSTIENMRVVGNGFIGVQLGSYGKVTDSIMSGNYNGIACYDNCHIERNVLSSNLNEGVDIGSGTVLGNTIQHNGSYGVYANTTTGYGNNTLSVNNGGGAQVFGPLIRLQPNACSPTCQ